MVSAAISWCPALFAKPEVWLSSGIINEIEARRALAARYCIWVSFRILFPALIGGRQLSIAWPVRRAGARAPEALITVGTNAVPNCR